MTIGMENHDSINVLLAACPYKKFSIKSFALWVHPVVYDLDISCRSPACPRQTPFLNRRQPISTRKVTQTIHAAEVSSFNLQSTHR